MELEGQPRKGTFSPVLIVDDDHRTRELIALALGTADLEVVQAATAQQALDLLDVGTFGAVVLDNHLPGMSGLELVRIVRSRREMVTLPIILVTGDDAAADRVAGLGSGATDYVVKPFVPDELVARVLAHLRTQALWSEVVDAHRQE